jgi:hypothetical protein
MEYEAGSYDVVVIGAGVRAAKPQLHRRRNKQTLLLRCISIRLH